MQKFKIGDKVRQQGKMQVMTVEGDAALAAVSTRPGRVATTPGMVVCSWANKRGRKIQKAFVELGLEFAE
ncbi:hypothetical protein [Paraburkholderia sp. BL10I2N1]|uniref:hypothetical protein n=1 Tax=Paraburkholderia sp. BL10I2N1 TaxID=1938796 RepID=UPI001061B9C8|nr:hypothetical protein [Paraburkholderia sp. BL10I2N1]TDN58995.1 hypothetical protein B0G77_8179 [Paraburkholderia sp. BL10I2N1]